MFKYIKGLDTVRAIAALLVVLDHWNDYRGPGFSMYSIPGFIDRVFIPTGSFAVNLFFVLSGFLITSILLKAKKEQVDHTTILKTFYLKRALRIFPVYYATIMVLWLLDYDTVRSNSSWLLSYTSNLEVYLHQSWNAFSHSWSLAVEEQFYMIWPWVILFTPDKYLKHVFIAFLSIGILSTFWILKVKHSFSAVLPYNCFDAFGIGGAYAYATLNKLRLAKLRKLLRFAFPIALAIYFFWKLAPYFGYLEHLNFASRTIDSIVSLGIIDLVIHCKDNAFRRKVLENKRMMQIGTFSYGIYLFHYPVDHLYDTCVERLLIKHPSLPSIIDNFYFAYFVKLVLLFSISYVSYRFFEKKFLNLKNRIGYEKNKIQQSAGLSA